MVDLESLSVGARLGRGGEGEVYLATDGSGQRFALKLFRAGPQFDRGLWEQRLAAFPWDHNAAVLPALAHGEVATAPAALRRQLAQQGRDVLFAILPFVDGVPLSELLETTPLAPVEAVAVLGEMALLLERLPAGVGHGDVRAANVFVQRYGQLVLLDPALFVQPNSGDDLRALGKLGEELLGDRAGETTAIMLRGLLRELAMDGLPLGVAEVNERLVQLAALVHAPSAAVVLRPRMDGLRRELLAGPSAPPKPRKPRVRRRLGLWVGLPLGVLALAAASAAAWVVLAWLPTHRDTVSVVTAGSASVLAAGQLYGSPEVHHAGAVYVFVCGAETADRRRGAIEFRVATTVTRVVLLSALRQPLWEEKNPQVGKVYCMDVPPGNYFTEEDRVVPEGIQEDVRPVQVDVLHPLRFETHTEVMMSPHPD